MNTSDMHPFIHPLSAAVDPAWEAKSDWEIYKAIAKKFSEVCVGHLGKETDIVTLPIQHDSAAELAQPLDVKDWKKRRMRPDPGQNCTAHYGRRARLSSDLRTLYLYRPADGENR